MSIHKSGQHSFALEIYHSCLLPLIGLHSLMGTQGNNTTLLNSNGFDCACAIINSNDLTVDIHTGCLRISYGFGAADQAYSNQANNNGW